MYNKEMNYNEMNESLLDEVADTYATKDLYFAAFLHVKGIQIVKLEKYGNGNYGRNPVYFIFNDKQRCEELESLFWNGVSDELMVNIKDFTTAVRDLRSRAFSVTRTVNQVESSFDE